MVGVIRETIHSNSKRIWGTFKLSDKSTTHFEMRKGESWFQWGNTTDNLWLTCERVKKLCERWLETEMG